MVRFYGLSIEEVINMPKAQFDDFWLCISILEAQERLMEVKVANYPYLKETPRKEFYNFLKKESKLDKGTTKLRTPQEIAAAIGAFTNGKR
tara:strand:+ start:267 stop:539 length:273 start_codon:yes stop_codon:yes gene_type:complete